MAKSRERLTADLDVQMRDMKARLSALDQKSARGEARITRNEARLRAFEQRRRASEARMRQMQSQFTGFARTQLQAGVGLVAGLAVGGDSEFEQVVSSGVAGLAAGGPHLAAAAVALTLVSNQLTEQKQIVRELWSRLDISEKERKEIKRKLDQVEANYKEAIERADRKITERLGKEFNEGVKRGLDETARYLADQRGGRVN